VSELERIGTIVRLQVQRESLKGTGLYVSDPLLAVEAAALTAPGFIGQVDGAWVVDVHHSSHPRRRGNDQRAVSVGFTAHYERMAAHFADVPLGIGGENIIVDGPFAPREDDLAGGVVIDTGEGRRVSLDGVRVAAPCVPFTSYLLGLPGLADRTDIAADLEFLDGGTRGFVFGTRHVDQPVLLYPGGVVYRVAT